MKQKIFQSLAEATLWLMMKKNAGMYTCWQYLPIELWFDIKKHLLNIISEDQERRRLGMDYCWKKLPYECWWLIRKEFLQITCKSFKSRRIFICKPRVSVM